jgi:hypothetical protein
METLLLILLIVIALSLLSGGFRTQPPPQIIYVEAPPEPSRRSFGCLPWIVGCFVLLVLLGVIRV